MCFMDLYHSNIYVLGEVDSSKHKISRPSICFYYQIPHECKFHWKLDWADGGVHFAWIFRNSQNGYFGEDLKIKVSCDYNTGTKK